MASYLEDFIEKLGSLPIDVNRGLRLLKELDGRFRDSNQRLVELQEEYAGRMKNAKDKKQEAQKPDTQAMMEEIKQLQEECLAYSRSKIDVSGQNYDVVEKQIEKLDAELRKFEDELKVQNGDQSAQDDHKGLKHLKKAITKTQSNIKPTKNPVPSALEITPEPLDTAKNALDQNEPRYCVCNGVSYGDMISCDNTFCEKEWFHFACINLSSKPKGKWYCNDCKVLKNKNMLKF